MGTCSNCPFSQREKPIVKERTFYVNGSKLVAAMKRVNDAFYEIVGGKYAGNWVHIFDVI